MAEAEYRLWNPQWHNCSYMVPVRKDKDGNYPMAIEISISEIASAAAEIGTAATAAKDGTTTPFIAIAVSSSASDDSGATDHLQRIHLIGISVSSAANYILGKEDPVYSIEEIVLNGVADVNSVRYYLRVLHAYGVSWGSGGSDAAGNVTIEAPANTALLTMDAGDNETNNSGMIWLATNYEGRWTRLFISLNDAALNQT